MISVQKSSEVVIGMADLHSAGYISIMLLVPRLELYSTGKIDQ